MGRSDFFQAGSWNFICDNCGTVHKASESLLQWNNLRVCRECWEPRNPQDFVRPIPDPKPIPWSRPLPPLTFQYQGGMTGRVIDQWMLDSISLG